MTDLFEMDSVVFEGRFLNVKSQNTFAWTYNERFESRATIFMNIHMIQALTKEEFETGIFLHELAHVACVKCKLFDCNHKKNCKRDDPECPDYFCQSFHHTGLWHQISADWLTKKELEAMFLQTVCMQAKVPQKTRRKLKRCEQITRLICQSILLGL